ncbi:HTH domain-containing protein [Desulfitobacterium sp. Sab5]|uniref:HTH domain-containing protein n=1 Tax=Desulfitobacterium nosdiversum TaxID=3375356 RepID=UPI003CF3B09D
MDEKMGTNRFTEEQQAMLRQNPYVVKVSETSITYSVDFKERFYREYKAGNMPSAILRGMGFDPRVLGKKRIDRFVGNVSKYEAHNEDFHDRRKDSTGRPRTKDLTSEEKISRLEHQVQYLKQENEFLKKINFLEKKAQWEAKRRQQKNTRSSKK